MDPLIALVSTLLLLFLIPLFLFRRSRTTVKQDAGALNIQTEPQHVGTRRMRRRNMEGASSSRAEQVDQDDEMEEELDQPAYYATRSSKKKEMKKQEKEARRQAEDTSREMRRQKQDKYAEMRRRKDEEREAEEQRKEEEARMQRLKEEEAANVEFEKWKESFTVDTEGTMEDGLEEESRGLLNDFVGYIKKHKCVQLEDLAAEFHLRTQDAISRILSLEKMGRLSGVMDDRGKYIYISLEEMKAVADYIKARGRVSIAHLASKSNEFIDLEPKLLEDEDIGMSDGNALANLNSALPSVAVA